MGITLKHLEKEENDYVPNLILLIHSFQIMFSSQNLLS